jgi:uncharacterized Zn-binding protein involved in type VI secretion
MTAKGGAAHGELSMRTLLVVGLSQILICAGAALAVAQQRPEGPPAGAPGVITEGSSNTSIGGQSAARKGDRTDGGGITVGGGSGVFINGKPAARAGDLTTGCPGK